MKSPAVLFYTSDFLTGTIFMSNEQVGKYIKLLCMQHQQGRLNEEDFFSICNRNDKKVIDKFIIDKNGNYYNQRMEEEINKRLDYSKSRAENRSKNKKDMINICKTYDKHMENDNINIYNALVKPNASYKPNALVKPKLDEVKKYCEERNNNVDYNKWFDFYESKGWMVGKNKMKNWKASVRTWERKSNDPIWLNKKVELKEMSIEEQNNLRKELDSFETKSS